MSKYIKWDSIKKLAILLILFGITACSQKAVNTPNIIIYLVDTLRADHLGAYGYPRSTSPNVDKLSKGAVLFSEARTTSSWTKPATASLLSGLPPKRHGGIRRADVLYENVVLFGQYLKRRQYKNFAFVTNPNVLPIWGFDRGFDIFYDIESVELSARADKVNEIVVNHMQKDISEPFFYYVHTRDPHAPYSPPSPYDHLWKSRPHSNSILEKEKARYDGEIYFNDYHFGKLLSHFEKKGKLANSLIIFLSDHGEEFGDHGGFGHGKTLFEEQLAIPLMIRLPQQHNPGTIKTEPVSIVDIVPTILAHVGLEQPPQLRGTGYSNILEDNSAMESSDDKLNRAFFFDLDLRSGELHSAVDGLLIDQLKVLRVHSPIQRTLLFNIACDPDERDNLASRNSEKVTAFSQLIDEQFADTSRGIHLWLVNGGDGREKKLTGELRTSGKFVAVRQINFESDDKFSLTDNNSCLTFSVTLLDKRNPVNQPPEILVDIDKLKFEVDPVDSQITIKSIKSDTQEGVFFLGEDKSPLSQVPFTINPTASSLQVNSMNSLFEASSTRSVLAKTGAYLAVVPSIQNKPVVPGDSLQKRLNALGYVE